MDGALSELRCARGRDYATSAPRRRRAASSEVRREGGRTAGDVLRAETGQGVAAAGVSLEGAQLRPGGEVPATHRKLEENMQNKATPFTELIIRKTIALAPGLNTAFGSHGGQSYFIK